MLCEGVADILRRDPASPRERKAKARQVLGGPWLQALCRTLAAEKNHSPYALPIRLKSTALVAKMEESRRAGTAFFGKMDWLGWYLTGACRERG